MDGHEIKHKDSAYPSYRPEISETGRDTGTWRGLEIPVGGDSLHSPNETAPESNVCQFFNLRKKFPKRQALKMKQSLILSAILFSELNVQS